MSTTPAGWTRLAFVALLALGGCAAEEPADKPAVATTTSADKATTTVAAVPVVAVFDVPSLVGMSIDQVRTTLGPPDDDPEMVEPDSLQRQNGIDEWDNQWDRDGVVLLVTFTSSSREVVDFFIVAPRPMQNVPADREELLTLGTLADGTSAYRIDFVTTPKDPDVVTGVKVTPI